MNRTIPWMRLSLRTAEPQACLQAIPSNLHSPPLILIRGHAQEGAVIAVGWCRFLILLLPRDALSSSSPHFSSSYYISFIFSSPSSSSFALWPPTSSSSSTYFHPEALKKGEGQGKQLREQEEPQTEKVNNKHSREPWRLSGKLQKHQVFGKQPY